MITLEQIKNALQGVIPTAIMSCSRDGIPNVAYLSQVHYIDSKHIALTTQYFNKTKKNLIENPICTLRVVQPATSVVHQITAKHLRSETTGPIFDEMKSRLAVIADYTGAGHLLILEAIEILEVQDIVKLMGETDDGDIINEHPNSKPSRFSLESLQKACEQVNLAKTLEEVFDSILEVMDQEFDFKHSMILLPDENSKFLQTIAIHGYPQEGVGSEVEFGKGIIGRAATQKAPLVHTSLVRELIYAKSSYESKENQFHKAIMKAIPLPGLKNSKSQIAIPLLLRNELLGVLFAESEEIFEFKEVDEQLLKTLGSVLAMSMHSLRSLHYAESEPAPLAKKETPLLDDKSHLVISYYQEEDCIFVNGEYLIRNIPARILWQLLNQFKSQGKKEFTNRELRMDPFLQLPEIKDNLETRLILLKKRMEKKCPAISIASSGRGRFTLQIHATVDLEKR